MFYSGNVDDGFFLVGEMLMVAQETNNIHFDGDLGGCLNPEFFK